MFSRLDRALCNDRWRVAFPNALVKVLPRVEFSDHHPILLCLHGNVQDRRARPFRFESAWLTHDSFKDDMKGWWQAESDLEQKLSSLENDLLVWKQTTFGCIYAKKRSLLVRLGGIQKQFQSGKGNIFLVNLEKSLQKDLNDILQKEELMWYQRSRTQWLQDGDRNTKYYQIKAANRKRKNRIHLLRDDLGAWLADEEATKVHVNKFFHSLFLETGTNDEQCSYQYGFNKLNAETILTIGRTVENEEIESALFSMKAWKAPGLDGYPAGFYHANWHLIALDFYTFVRNIWQDPARLASVNSTDICLIPKVDKPEFVSQFRPISLCNVSYKVVTKIIVNRVSERIRCFIWQVFHGKLETKAYCGRWSNGDVYCHQCRNMVEDIMHVLRDCTVAVSLWNSFIPPSLRSDFYGADEDGWLAQNLSNTTVLNDSLIWCNVWATGCYYLWFWRNKFVHGDDFVFPVHPSRIVMQQVYNYEDGRGKQAKLSSITKQQLEVRWRPPAHGFVAINTNGAAKVAHGIAGCGGVARDSHGRWLCGFAKRLFVSSAYLAELWGDFEGIKLALSRGFTAIELQMDSLIIVSCINRNTPGGIAGRHILTRIRQMLACFQHVSIIHVYREGNKVADALASLGCRVEDVINFACPPPTIKYLVDADVIGVSTPRMILV